MGIFMFTIVYKLLLVNFCERQSLHHEDFAYQVTRSTLYIYFDFKLVYHSNDL